jgi:hypothetical protein
MGLKTAPSSRSDHSIRGGRINSVPDNDLLATRLRQTFTGFTLEQTSEELVASWPSQNPAVAEDLALIARDENPSVRWFKGYMFDFPEVLHGSPEAQVEAIIEFLQAFFAEEIAQGVYIHPDGAASGGGPVSTDQLNHPESWWQAENVAIRSWRGTYDK